LLLKAISYDQNTLTKVFINKIGDLHCFTCSLF